MKRPSRKASLRSKPRPTPDQIRHYMRALSDEHQLEWHRELHSDAPYWVYLLNLHLRMVELDHLEAAAAELL